MVLTMVHTLDKHQCGRHFNGRQLSGLNKLQGFFQLFAQGGGQNEIVWIIGGGSKYVSMCKACGKLGGPGECSPGKF